MQTPLLATLLGREHPRAVLRVEVERTLTSHGGLVLVVGEAGIGKTTLVAEALREVDEPAVVVHGMTWDRAGAPGFWPWVQVMRGLERSLPREVWEAARGAAGDDLDVLLVDRQPSSPAPRRVEDAAVFQLHDAVTRLLVTVARSRPVVVALDDLHWADVASLRLLEFVARHTWFERLLVVGTYRDAEVAAQDHPLHPHLTALAQRGTMVSLGGLEEREVAALVTRSTGRRPDDVVVQEIHRRSGGNPFFVEQLASLWHSGGSIGVIPPGIRETIDTRLGQLSADAVRVLTTAALLGRDFAPAVVTEATDLAERLVETCLDQAVAGRLLVRRNGTQLAFVHDLVREALLDSLGEDERRQRHADLIPAIEHVALREHRSVVSDLAHHAYLAVPVVPPSEALDRLTAAAEHACQRRSADEAVELFRRMASLVDDDDLPRLLEVQHDLATALHAVGDLNAARELLEDQLARARSAGEVRWLARSVFALHELGVPDPDADWRRELELVEEALERLDADGATDDDPLRIRLVAVWSRVQAHGVYDEHAIDEASARAVELARASDDTDLLGFCLLARHDVVWRPGTAPERLELADEMASVARLAQDATLRLHASLLRMVALLELGDRAAFAEHARLEALAHDERAPRFRYLARSRAAMLATLQGRFDEARDVIDEANALGEQLGEVDRDRLWLEQRWANALLQGDLDEADELMQRPPWDGDPLHVLEAVVANQRGGRSAPSPVSMDLIEVAADGYPRMFRAGLMHVMAQLAVSSRDPELLAMVRDELTPLRELWAVVAGGGVVYGPYAYWLARVDAAEDRWDSAGAGFASAARSADALGALPWAVLSRLGEALARQARGDDVLEELREVVLAAEDLGMSAVTDEASAAMAAPHPGEAEPAARRAQPVAPAEEPPDGAAPGGPTRDPSDDWVAQDGFRPDGSVWELTYAGKTVRVPSAKGLRDLHVLLSRPGIEVPAVDLLDPEGGEVVRAAKQLGGDPILDEQARAAYRDRVTQLDDGIEQATLRGDDDRAAELDREREALLQELRSATGLAGRPRRLGDEAERARKTVTARIRDTLRRLDEHHPELAEHLRASVSTGSSCRYQPGRTVDWRL